MFRGKNRCTGCAQRPFDNTALLILFAETFDVTLASFSPSASFPGVQLPRWTVAPLLCRPGSLQGQNRLRNLRHEKSAALRVTLGLCGFAPHCSRGIASCFGRSRRMSVTLSPAPLVMFFASFCHVNCV